VDYTFAQVSIDTPQVIYTGNCGNISAGVGPFAIDGGLIPATEGVTRVRIYNTNTDRLLIADVPVAGGKARVTGDFAVPGVPGTGAEILLDYSATVGAKTGKLLPTGHANDSIELEDGRSITLTACDAANPCAWLRASDVGLSGSELADRINHDPTLAALMLEIRGKAAVLFGFCQNWRNVDTESPGIPMVGVVAAPADYRTLHGGSAEAADMDLRVRLMFMNRLHESIAGTGSMCLAAASRIPGSVVASIIGAPRNDTLRIGHPSGIMTVKVRAGADPAKDGFSVLGLSRTARRIADCVAYHPLS
jgi:2-methylaconitate cis-trans-isomerase PrpF